MGFKKWPRLDYSRRWSIIRCNSPLHRNRGGVNTARESKIASPDGEMVKVEKGWNGREEKSWDVHQVPWCSHSCAPPATFQPPPGAFHFPLFLFLTSLRERIFCPWSHSPSSGTVRARVEGRGRRTSYRNRINTLKYRFNVCVCANAAWFGPEIFGRRGLLRSATLHRSIRSTSPQLSAWRCSTPSPLQFRSERNHLFRYWHWKKKSFLTPVFWSVKSKNCLGLSFSQQFNIFCGCCRLRFVQISTDSYESPSSVWLVLKT